jgi:hypothetical protein
MGSDPLPAGIPFLGEKKFSGTTTMNEKRQYPRHSCHMKVRFSYYEGDPDTIDIRTAVPKKGKGLILDISRGGLFIASDVRVNINVPIEVEFKTKTSLFSMMGSIVRTGMIRNNPSESVKKYADMKLSEKSYIAVQFTKPLDFLDEEDLQRL